MFLINRAKFYLENEHLIALRSPESYQVFLDNKQKIIEASELNETRERRLIDEALYRIPCPVDEFYLAVKEEIPLDGLVVDSYHSVDHENNSGQTYRQLSEPLFFNKKRSSDVSGSGFLTLGKELAAREHFLIEAYRNHNLSGGYTELTSLPLVCRAGLYKKSGQPTEDAFQILPSDGEERYLIPTGETAIMCMLQGTFFLENQKFFALTECFRNEAGKNSKIKDYMRLKQFKKTELIEICKASDGFERLNSMLNHATSLLRDLGISYRVKLLHPTDISAFKATITYDIEAYLPISKYYVEVSSITLCSDTQTSPLNISVRSGRTVSLNGSCFSLPRMLMVHLETYPEFDVDSYNKNCRN